MTVSLIACGDTSLENGDSAGAMNTDNPQGLTADEASQGFEAVNAMLNRGTRMNGQALAGFDYDRSFSRDCEGGGTADFSGSVAATWETGSAGADFSYTVNFENCSAYGIEIDGEMDYSRTTAMADSTLETSFAWTGDLSWSGLVTGDCTIDLSGSTTASLVDWDFEATSQTDGTVCGYDATNEVSLDF
jgi:hypothetical protein